MNLVHALKHFNPFNRAEELLLAKGISKKEDKLMVGTGVLFIESMT